MAINNNQFLYEYKINIILLLTITLVFSAFIGVLHAQSDCVLYPDQTPFNAKDCYHSEVLQWDEATLIEQLAEGEEHEIILQGGKANYTFSISGEGFRIIDENGEEQTALTTASKTVTIRSNAHCGSVEIQVLDKCKNSLIHSIRSTVGQWKRIDDLVRLGVGQATGLNPTYSTTVYADENTKYRTSQLYTRFRGFNAHPAEERVDRGCAHGADNYRVNYGEPYVTPPEPWIKCSDTWVWHHPEWTDRGSVNFLVSGTNGVVNGWEEGAITEKWTCVE